MNSVIVKAQPVLLSVLRIVTGFLFIEHGTQKWLLFPGGTTRATVENLGGIAGIFELVGGALIVVGLFTRPVAFILSGLMAFAYFMGHASKGSPLLPMLNQGELAVAWSFLFLYFSVAGAGAWALDNVIGRGRLSRRNLQPA